MKMKFLALPLFFVSLSAFSAPTQKAVNAINSIISGVYSIKINNDPYSLINKTRYIFVRDSTIYQFITSVSVLSGIPRSGYPLEKYEIISFDGFRGTAFLKGQNGNDITLVLHGRDRVDRINIIDSRGESSPDLVYVRNISNDKIAEIIDFDVNFNNLKKIDVDLNEKYISIISGIM